MILSGESDIPSGVEVEIINVPEGSGWIYQKSRLVKARGKIAHQYPDRIEILFEEVKKFPGWGVCAGIACTWDSPVEIRRLDDPDENY